MILIVSSPEDDHAQAVRAELDRLGVRAALVDLSRFPQELRLAARYEDGGRSYELHDGEPALNLDDVRVVWWRRPQPFELHPEIAQGQYAHFAYSECVEAFAGLWQSLDAEWINHPTREEVAARKLHQLRVAQEVGLEIPRTLITNSPDEARSFAEAHGDGGVAYKTFLPAGHDWRETRVLRGEELAELDSVGYAPVIFQEYVPVELDLRVTVVGEQVFAAAIHTAESSYEVDYRMDLDNARVEPFELPAAVLGRIDDLMDRLGLVYGAIDMRLTPDGRFVFLEINPTGEWRFVEERAGLGITPAFSALLAERSAASADVLAPLRLG